MRIPLLPAAVLAASALAVPAVAIASSGPSARPASTVQVRDDYFKPGALTISKGSSITLRWVGRRPHNAVGAGVNLRKTRVSGSKTVRPSRSGTIYCTIHSGMKLRVKLR